MATNNDRCILPTVALLLLVIMFARAPTTASSPTGSVDVREASGLPDPWTPPGHQRLVQILRAIGYINLATTIETVDPTERLRSTDSDSLFGWNGTATLFAPSDHAFDERTPLNPMISLDILRLQTVRGVYSSPDLATLPAGTALQTLVPGRFLVIAPNRGADAEYPNDGGASIRDASIRRGISVNGVAVTHPDIFNDGSFAIHGVDHFLDTSYAAVSESLTDQSVPTMANDAIFSLRNRGYGVLALAMRLEYAELAGLDSLTIFAPDDDSFFSGAQGFMKNFRYHVVPNNRFLFADLVGLPAGTRIDTLLPGESLCVTSTVNNCNGSVIIAINNVPLKNSDAFYDPYMAVHGIPVSLPHLPCYYRA